MFRKRIRAWHKANRKMYKVALLDFENELAILHEFMPSANVEDTFKVYLKGVILLQESGLRDDRNFYIFEGDIVKWEDMYYAIKYGDYGDIKKGTNGFGWHIAGMLGTHPYLGGAEKVGNIYENPELL